MLRCGNRVESGNDRAQLGTTQRSTLFQKEILTQARV